MANVGRAVERGVRIDLMPKKYVAFGKSEKQQPGGEVERRVTYRLVKTMHITH